MIAANHAANNNLYCNQHICKQSINDVELDYSIHDFKVYSPIKSLYCLYLINFVYENKIPKYFKSIQNIKDAQNKTIGSILLLESTNNVFITFRGTANVRDCINDLKTRQVQLKDSEGKVEKGFYSIYKSFRDDLLKFPFHKYNIILCGHSLGGSLALLTALDLMDKNSITVYTYGCPHVFDPVAAKDFIELQKRHHSRVFRIQNSCDIVSFFPLPVSFHAWNTQKLYYYVPVGHLYEFTDNRFSFAENHSIYTYIDNVRRITLA
jgi:hypothetical protein